MDTTEQIARRLSVLGPAAIAARLGPLVEDVELDITDYPPGDPRHETAKAAIAHALREPGAEPSRKPTAKPAWAEDADSSCSGDAPWRDEPQAEPRGSVLPSRHQGWTGGPGGEPQAEPGGLQQQEPSDGE